MAEVGWAGGRGGGGGGVREPRRRGTPTACWGPPGHRWTPPGLGHLLLTLLLTPRPPHRPQPPPFQAGDDETPAAGAASGSEQPGAPPPESQAYGTGGREWVGRAGRTPGRPGHCDLLRPPAHSAPRPPPRQACHTCARLQAELASLEAQVLAPGFHPPSAWAEREVRYRADAAAWAAAERGLQAEVGRLRAEVDALR